MKPALSKSQLKMLRRCAMQFYYRYVEGIIERPGTALVIGTATHRAIEMNLQEKMNTGHLLADDAVAEAAFEALGNTWDGEQPVLYDQEAVVGEAATKGWAADVTARLALAHHHAIAPRLQPTHLERAFRLELRDYPVDLEGHIDIQEAGWVRDIKTSGKVPRADEADTSIDLTAYALGIRTVDGCETPRVALDIIIKNKEPKVVTLESTRDNDDFRLLREEVGKAATIISAGAFLPTSPDSWVCSELYCGYFNRCPYGARGRNRPKETSNGN